MWKIFTPKWREERGYVPRMNSEGYEVRVIGSGSIYFVYTYILDIIWGDVLWKFLYNYRHHLFAHSIVSNTETSR